MVVLVALAAAPHPMAGLVLSSWTKAGATLSVVDAQGRTRALSTPIRSYTRGGAYVVNDPPGVLIHDQHTTPDVMTSSGGWSWVPLSATPQAPQLITEHDWRFLAGFDGSLFFADDGNG